jgi:hypothetical protein
MDLGQICQHSRPTTAGGLSRRGNEKAPAVGGLMPANILSNVDLPLPLGPTIPEHQTIQYQTMYKLKPLFNLSQTAPVVNNANTAPIHLNQTKASLEAVQSKGLLCLPLQNAAIK